MLQNRAKTAAPTGVSKTPPARHSPGFDPCAAHYCTPTASAAPADRMQVFVKVVAPGPETPGAHTSCREGTSKRCGDDRALLVPEFHVL
jgi:hypothetical protein